MPVCTIQFSLNVITEFSDKNTMILGRLLVSSPLSLVWETDTLPLCHRDTVNREDSYIDPNSGFSDLSEFLNYPNSVNSMKVLLHLGKISIDLQRVCMW